MKICECGDVVKEDESGHVDPERDRHKAVVVQVVDFEPGDPPDPKERQVAEVAAALIDEAVPPPLLTEDEREALAREHAVEANQLVVDSVLPAALSKEDEDLL